VRRSFSQILYGRYPKDLKFHNSEYAGHQVGPKDFGSRNFSILAFKGKAVGVAQILHSTVTARDIWKKIAQIMFFSHKKS
jgi:hypothetical protein